MTFLAQRDCCTMLGIDPKTLRHWLQGAHMQFCPHPTDARLKCLTSEQVQQLATLHARSLARSPDSSPPLPAVAASPDHTATAPKSAPRLSDTVDQSPETEWRKAVAELSAQVLTLQEQLTQLTLELLRERSERYEQRLSTLEALLPGSVPRSFSPPSQPLPFSCLLNFCEGRIYSSRMSHSREGFEAFLSERPALRQRGEICVNLSI